MEDFLTKWADYALYLPAVNKGFGRFAAQTTTPALSARMPSGIAAADLNFLDPSSPLYHYPYTLYTAAFAVGDSKPEIIKNRDKATSFVLGDSGGFSLINGVIKTPHAVFRQQVLDWQEQYCNVGIILDVPTRSLNVQASGYTKFDQCLSQTVDNLKFAKNARSNSGLNLLSVYQGRDHKESKAWAKAIEPLPLEGLAIAGHTRLDMWFWAGIFHDMIGRGKFDHVKHIHFLGTSQPTFAILATALQRALRKHVRADITVSFDSSLGFAYVYRHGQITTGLKQTQNGLRLTTHQLPSRGGEFDPTKRFAYRSPLADQCVNGDFMPGTDPTKLPMDEAGNAMLSNHAVYMELSAILQANLLADLAQQNGNSPVPHSVRRSIALIDQVFAGANSQRDLASLRALLKKKPFADAEDKAEQKIEKSDL